MVGKNMTFWKKIVKCVRKHIFFVVIETSDATLIITNSNPILLGRFSSGRSSVIFEGPKNALDILNPMWVHIYEGDLLYGFQHPYDDHGIEQPINRTKKQEPQNKYPL